MENIWLGIFIGHIVGDFIFQFKVMADNKYQKGAQGTFWCSIHCLIYTICVSLFVQNFSFTFMALTCIPHWIIDRNSLAYKWMQINGSAKLFSSNNPKDISFGSIIYVVIDQFFHFVCLYVLIKNL